VLSDLTRVSRNLQPTTPKLQNSLHPLSPNPVSHLKWSQSVATQLPLTLLSPLVSRVRPVMRICSTP
jgi:hypothetical protein